MTDDELTTVTITGPDIECLADIVRSLIDARLAACGNIVPTVTSIYRWDGQTEQTIEALALIHTRSNLLHRLQAMVAELHPYDVPQIVALRAQATDAYSAWLRASTRPDVEG